MIYSISKLLIKTLNEPMQNEKQFSNTNNVGWIKERHCLNSIISGVKLIK